MYRSVYNHRLNVVCNWLLERLVRLARQLGPNLVWADGVMQRWLWNKEELDLDSFLANDDVRTGYHLQRWQEEDLQRWPASAAASGTGSAQGHGRDTAHPRGQLQALAVAGGWPNNGVSMPPSAVDCVIRN